MREDEKRHYRNGYAIGLVLAEMRQHGKRITATYAKPAQYPAPRVSHDAAAYRWGITTALAGRPPLF